MGARWRVGDDNTIRIFFYDPWLLKEGGGRVISPPPTFLSTEATIDAIINSHSTWWNSHLIDLCFNLPEPQQIKSIPLCTTPQPGILIWLKENNGAYLLKRLTKALSQNFHEISGGS